LVGDDTPLKQKYQQMVENAPTEAEVRELELKQAEHERLLALGSFLRARGARYERCTLQNYRTHTKSQQAVRDAILGFSEDMALHVKQGDGVILLGPAGTGKDHLLVGLARVAIMKCRFTFSGSRRNPVQWTNGADLFASVRDAIKNEDENRVVNGYIQDPILVISDPTPVTGAITEFQANTLYRIIDGRYSRCKPTWVSINVGSRQEAEEKLGVQVVDRLAHNSLVLQCDWPSYRRNASYGSENRR